MKLFRRRSARTGRFVDAATAASDPAGTVVETIDHIRMAALELVDTMRSTGDDTQLCPATLNAFQRLAEQLDD